MKSSLKTLARIRKFNIDEQRKRLNEQLDVEKKILSGLEQLNRQFGEEKVFVQKNGSAGDFGAYVKRYLAQRESLEQALELVRQKIAEIRDIIADLFKEQKNYEIVDKNREERAMAEEEHKMQQALDEISTNTYIKRQKE